MKRWSAAMRQFDVLEPWLTESHWDENYWDDVAERIVESAGAHPSPGPARDALACALRATFPSVELEANNGFYREELDRRLDAIVASALDPTISGGDIGG